MLYTATIDIQAMSSPLHRRAVEIATLAKILAEIREGDSLSDLQGRTGLTFVTVQRAVRALEEASILATRVNTNDRGRARECVAISPAHQRAARFYMDVLPKMDTLLRGDAKGNPLLFQIPLYGRALAEARAQLPEASRKTFDEWTAHPAGVASGARGERLFERRGDRLFLDPEQFQVKVRLAKEASEATPEKRERALTLDAFARGRGASSRAGAPEPEK
jgi:hypothetical protein